MDCRAGQGCAGPICTPGWAPRSLVLGLPSSSDLTIMGHTQSGSPFVSRSNLGSRTDFYQLTVQAPGVDNLGKCLVLRWFDFSKSYSGLLGDQSSDRVLK